MRLPFIAVFAVLSIVVAAAEAPRYSFTIEYPFNISNHELEMAASGLEGVGIPIKLRYSYTGVTKGFLVDTSERKMEVFKHLADSAYFTYHPMIMYTGPPKTTLA